MKEQSTTKGFAVLSVAGMVAKMLSLLYVPLLLHIIGEEGYGIYAAAYDIFSLPYVMTNAGMQVAIAKQVSELEALNNHKDAVKTFKIARAMLLFIGTAIALGLAIFAKPITRLTDNDKAFYAVIALSPAIVVTSVLSAYRGYFQGRSIMTPTAVSQILEQIANIFFSLGFAYVLMKKGVEGGAAGGTIGTTIGAVLAGVYLIKIYRESRTIKVNRADNKVKVRRLSNQDIVKKLFKYGIPITLSSGMQYLGAVIDMSIVKNRLIVAGFNKVDRNIKYSILSRYRTLIYVPLTIIAALSSAVLPAISRSVALNDRKGVKEKIDFALKISYIISIPSAVGLAVLSKEIFALLKYGSGHELMIYGSVVVIFMSIVQIQTTILQSMNKLYVVLISLGVGILAKLVSNYYLVAIPYINVNGAVIGGMLCFLIPMIINNIALNRELKIRVSLLKHAIKPAIASILMGVVIFVINKNLNMLAVVLGNRYIITSVFTLISIVIGMFVYLYGLVLTGGITKKDVSSMPRRLDRVIPKFVKRRLR